LLILVLVLLSGAVPCLVCSVVVGKKTQPMDYVAGKHRGFAFVEYKIADDADEAVFNMDGAEYMGRALRVSLAQPNQLRKLASSSSNASAAAGGGQPTSFREEAIWKSDEWFQKQIMEGGDGPSSERMNAAANDAQHQEDVKALR
jgi:RNA recognition motif-containing protein